MSSYNKNKNFGLLGLLEGTTESEAELMNKARNEVMKKIGVTTWDQPASTDPVDFEVDLYTTTLMPKTTPVKEVKDEFGYTQKQNKEIEDYLTRPSSASEKTIKPKAKPMNILTYVDRMSNLYAGKDRQYDDNGKLLQAAPAKTKPVNTNLVKGVKNKWMYKSWFDEQKEYDDQVKKGMKKHPADSYYDEEIKRIEKKGKSWLVKHINKQDEELNKINGVSKADTEKRIATMGDPKSDGVWKKFVDKNK